MFRGGFEHTIDDKGRVIIPLKFRYQLGEKFIVTKGLGGCLFVLTEKDWRINFDEKFEAQPFFDASTMKLQRFFCAESIDATVDNQGRIALPAGLRDWAGLSIGVAVQIVGVTTRIEIWNKERWNKFNAELTEDQLVACAMAIGVGSPPVVAAS